VSRGAGDPRAVHDLEGFAALLDDPPVSPDESWRPELVCLAPGQREALEALCRERGTGLIDAFDRQMDDLAAVRLPGGSPDQRRAFVEEALSAAGGAEACGTWVWVPWESRIVHLLDEDDYVEVVTNRNRDKITLEEQRVLRTRRVGVVGLSVGGEAAVTVAQEHLCGSMALADFDALDLSNLNRLGAGFDDLGRSKAVIVARRIIKLDPYMDLTVLPEGVTEENLDGFLDGLDLLLEECDGLSLKHGIRVRARERELDVVFAGDERGFLSLEPYGQSPGLATFHGRVTAPQPPREAYDTPLDFMRALSVWLGGWDALSERSRRSLEQIGTGLCGYPQLAGEARYAAGQLAWFARRLLLGERVRPFVGHLDLDELIARPPAASGASVPTPLGEEG
jgi:hypothetical protein